MNRILLPISAALLFLAGYVAADGLNDLATKHIDAMKADGSLTNVINQLSASGEICNAKGGHSWEAGRVGETANFSYADYHPGVTFRHCIRCNLTQSQSLTNWK